MASKKTPTGIRVGRTGPKFALVFAAVLLTPEFMTAPDSAKRVYLSLCLHAGGSDRGWYLSAEKLAAETHQHIRSVWRGLRELVSRGLVQRVRRARTSDGQKLQGAEAEAEGWKMENLYLVNDEGPQVVELCEHCSSPYHALEGCSAAKKKPPNNPQDRWDSAVIRACDSGVIRACDSGVTTLEQTPKQIPKQIPPGPPQAGGTWNEEQVGFMMECLANSTTTDPEGAWWDRASIAEPELVRTMHLIMKKCSKPQKRRRYDTDDLEAARYMGPTKKRWIPASLIEAHRRHLETEEQEQRQ